MDRQEWLRGRRKAVEAAYDAGAQAYDDHPYPADLQRRFVERLVAMCPPQGIVLDAPCGTGRYFPIVAAAGRRVVGIDQSAGMLDRARARGIAVSLHHIGLQDLRYAGEFDAAMTVDAMENVFPEDWPLVLSKLHRAIRPGGYVYLTVEEVPDAVLDGAFVSLRERGLPVVRGEVIEGDVAGYHYYPGRDQVMRWLEAENLTVVEQATEAHEDWAYWHVLLRSG